MSSYIATDPFPGADASPLLRGDPYAGVSRILARPPCAPGPWPPVEDAALATARPRLTPSGTAEEEPKRRRGIVQTFTWSVSALQCSGGRSLKTRWYTYLLFKMNRRKVQREIAPVSAYRAHRMSHVALRRRRPSRTILHQITALFAIICYLLNSHHSASHKRQSSIIVKEGRGDPLKTKSDTHTYCSIYTQRITRGHEAPSQHATYNRSSRNDVS